MSNTPMTPAQCRSQLKKFNQPFREINDFARPTSGRDDETGLIFGPVHGCLIHHTGDDAPDTADRRVIDEGRAGLSGPLAHAGCTDDGVIELITWKRANHAGKGDRDVYNALLTEKYGDYPPKPDFDSVDGNDLLYGLEVYYSGSHPMTAKQYAAAVNWAAAICDFHGWTAKSAIGHKEWTKRKIDPGKCDMAKFRRDVDARIATVNRRPKPPVSGPKPEPFPPFFHTNNYLENDSPAGLRKGRKLGFKSIDLNFHIAGDGSWVCIHWPDLRGLVHENGKKATGRVSDHTWNYLSKLSSPYGKLMTAWGALKLAKDLGYEMVEVEVKDTPTFEQFKALKKASDDIGIKIVVKRLSSLPGCFTTLRRAHRAKLTTMILPRGTVKVSETDWAIIDYVRQGGANRIIKA